MELYLITRTLKTIWAQKCSTILLNVYNLWINLKINFFFSDVDDEGIERDSDDVEDYKSRHTKDLDHILDVSNF